jgi:uncharacterized RDD family membrane protein YckC
VSNLQAEIRAAIAANDPERARELLRQALREAPDAETYYLASQVALSEAQKREFLNRALALDPFHERARLALERLKLLSQAALTPSEPLRADSAPIYEMKQKETISGYRLAGIGERFLAALIDSAVLFVIGLVVGAFYSAIAPPPRTFEELEQQLSAVNLLGLVTSALYYVYFLTNRDGQTPGKAALGIRIVKLDGTRLTALDAILRNVIGYAISAFFLLLGYLWILVDSRRQGWHDKLARTVVIKAR